MVEVEKEKVMSFRALSQRLWVACEAGKGKDMDSPLEPAEGTSLADTLVLALQDSFWILASKNCKRVCV